jgi:hypothetical protein
MKHKTTNMENTPQQQQLPTARSKPDKRQGSPNRYSRLSHNDTMSKEKSNTAKADILARTNLDKEHSCSNTTLIARAGARTLSETAPHTNKPAPKEIYNHSSTNMVHHKTKVIRKTTLDKRHMDRHKSRIMAKAIAETRTKTEMSLLRYPFIIRDIENIVAKVYDCINPLHKDSISYREFGNCFRLVNEEDDDVDAAARFQMHPLTPFPDEVQQLSRTDALWHHIYCVAVPTLFTVDERSGDLVKTSLSVGSDDPIWILRKLTNQARDVGISPSKSRHALEILKILRDRFPPLLDSELIQQGSKRGAKRTRAETENSDRSDLTLKAYPTTDKDVATPTCQGQIPRYEESVSNINLSASPLTLEEKMEALAAEWTRKRKAGIWNGKIERVVFADRLYSHACQVLRRVSTRAPLVVGKDGAAQLMQHKTKKCVLTFADVISKVFQDGRSSSECSRLMIDIVKTTSELPGQQNAFLQWQDPKTGLNGVPVSKRASVWIDTNNYRRVRMFLTGENRPLDLDLDSKPTKGAGIASEERPIPTLRSSEYDNNKKRSPLAVANDDSERCRKSLQLMKAAAAVSRSRMLADLGLAASPLYDDPLSSTLNIPAADSSHTLEKKPIPTLRSSENDNNKKRPPPAAANDNSERSRKSLKLMTAAARRSRMLADLGLAASHLYDDSLSSTLKSPAVDSPHKSHKKIYIDTTMTDSKDDVDKPATDVIDHEENVVARALDDNRLRINPHQILCDADYQGGIVLQPSVNFPRGLRRLFQALNKGNRI